MAPIKHTLFLVSGVSSFIIFYMGIVNYLSATDKSNGMILLIFSILVAAGTLLSTVYISRSITKPIEKLAHNMREFSRTNKLSKKNPIKTNVQEIFELNENFETMGEQVEQTIEVQNEYVEKLKEMDRKKLEFSSMVSHELKTPLVPILGYVQMLQNKDLLGGLNEKQMEAVDEIHASTVKLQRLVGDILTTQKLDLGKLDFTEEKISFAELFNSIIKEFTPITNEKNINLELQFEGDVEIQSDRDRINQVFSNLIKNAIDFVPTNSGKITIGATESDKSLECFVKDNGVGISENNQKEIFKKFYQIDTSTSRKRSGSGLGLAICKGIIEGLGGKIWVESNESKGTKFYFTIPKKIVRSTIKKESD